MKIMVFLWTLIEYYKDAYQLIAQKINKFSNLDCKKRHKIN